MKRLVSRNLDDDSVGYMVYLEGEEPTDFRWQG